MWNIKHPQDCGWWMHGLQLLQSPRRLLKFPSFLHKRCRLFFYFDVGACKMQFSTILYLMNCAMYDRIIERWWADSYFRVLERRVDRGSSVFLVVIGRYVGLQHKFTFHVESATDDNHARIFVDMSCFANDPDISRLVRASNSFSFTIQKRYAPDEGLFSSVTLNN